MELWKTKRRPHYSITPLLHFRRPLSAWNFSETRQYEPNDGHSDQPHDSSGNR